MTIFVGGLYKKRAQALSAYEALRKAGFDKKDITMLVRKETEQAKFKSRTTPGDIFRIAAIGGLIGIVFGLALSLFMGQGIIPTQEFMPTFEPGNLTMIVTLTVITTLISAVFGIVIGASIKLIITSDDPEIASEGVMHGGLLVVVNVEKTQEITAQQVLEHSGAIDIDNLTEKWDPNIWSRFKGIEASARG